VVDILTILEKVRPPVTWQIQHVSLGRGAHAACWCAPIPHQLEKFWASQENKRNLQLLVRDIACNRVHGKVTIIASSLCFWWWSTSSYSYWWWIDSRPVALDRVGRCQAGSPCRLGCSCATMQESCRGLKRHGHFRIIATHWKYGDTSKAWDCRRRGSSMAPEKNGVWIKQFLNWDHHWPKQWSRLFTDRRWLHE